MVDIDLASANEATQTIVKMLSTTQQLLTSMSYEQRMQCEYPMNHKTRFDWDFIPKPDRTGVPLWQLDRHQRVLVHTLLKAGLSMRGYTQALQLLADDDLGFEILHGVPDAQREAIVIHHVAPADYVTRQVAKVGKVEYPDHIDLGIPSYGFLPPTCLCLSGRG